MASLITNQNVQVKKNKKILMKLRLNVKGNLNQKTYEKLKKVIKGITKSITM